MIQIQVQKKQEVSKRAGEIFHLAVTIKMILIRRLAGNRTARKVITAAMRSRPE